METNWTPAEVFTPGEYIRDELDARGWTQEDLANILGRPLVAVNQIINGKRSITPDTAKGLGAAFDTSAEFWMNLEIAFQLSQSRSEPDEVSLRSKLYALAPVTEMVRRGWIHQESNVTSLSDQLKAFFETDDLNSISIKVAARKSTSYDELSIPQRAWCARARRLARNITVAPYNEKKFIETMPHLRAITPSPEGICRLPKLLSELGVRIVIISHLERTKIDGAAFWLDKNSPVVAMSLRFDRLDNFWHTLMHELVHIKNRDQDVLDSEIDSRVKSEESETHEDEIEMRTNKEAAAYLVPTERLRSFITRMSPLYSRKKVIQFAANIGVHPAIVVGQLHHLGEIPPRNLRDLLVPIRHLIVGIAMTDGWGNTPGVI